MSTRVLHVLPHAGGGGETYIDMLERLAGFEHRRFYLSAGRTPVGAALSIPWRWRQLAAQLRLAHLIHVHGDTASAIVLPLLRSRTTVMTTHGLHLLRRSHGVRRALIERALAALASTCRTVICTSFAEHAELVTLVQARDRHKLRVIHNGIDPPPVVDQQERRSVRAELGLAAGTILALFVGQLESRKAPLVAARAATRARAGGAPVVLLIAGDGPQAEQLQALAGDAVRLLGYRADVPRLLAAADVFVAPSEREGLSFALLEAMARGVPVIAAEGAGMVEAVGDAALLSAIGDEAAIAGALARLVAEPGLRAQLGERARARVTREFSAAAFLSATEAVYKQALNVTAPGEGGGARRA